QQDLLGRTGGPKFLFHLRRQGEIYTPAFNLLHQLRRRESFDLQGFDETCLSDWAIGLPCRQASVTSLAG
ncbi:MAG: hypothetical protein SNJ49_15210, partial [Chloracidobacterium sp.]